MRKKTLSALGLVLPPPKPQALRGPHFIVDDAKELATISAEEARGKVAFVKSENVFYHFVDDYRGWRGDASLVRP
jgi:hypothetical protein